MGNVVGTFLSNGKENGHGYTSIDKFLCSVFLDLQPNFIHYSVAFCSSNSTLFYILYAPYKFLIFRVEPKNASAPPLVYV